MIKYTGKLVIIVFKLDGSFKPHRVLPVSLSKLEQISLPKPVPRLGT